MRILEPKSSDAAFPEGLEGVYAAFLWTLKAATAGFSRPPIPERVQVAGLRDFSAELGRWLSRDLIGERDTANIQAFLANNPLTKMNILGMEAYAECDQDRDCYVDDWEWDQCGFRGDRGAIRNCTPCCEGQDAELERRVSERFARTNCVLQGLIDAMTDWQAGDASLPDGMVERSQLQYPSTFTHWDTFLLPTAWYYQNNYSSPEDWDFARMCSRVGLNLPLFPPVLDPDCFFDASYEALLGSVLLHEPLHDLGQFGIGHEVEEFNWASVFSKGINGVAALVRHLPDPEGTHSDRHSAVVAGCEPTHGHQP